MSKVWKEKSKNEFTSKKEIFFLSFPKTQSILFFLVFLSHSSTQFFFSTLCNSFFLFCHFRDFDFELRSVFFDFLTWFLLQSFHKISRNSFLVTKNQSILQKHITYVSLSFLFGRTFLFFCRLQKGKGDLRERKLIFFFLSFLARHTHTHTPNVVIFFWWVFWYTKTLFTLSKNQVERRM